MKLEDFDNCCKVCGREFGSVSALHAHIKKQENLTRDEYYQKYYPKFDLYNGKPIPFKGREDYANRLFVDKRSEFGFLLKKSKTPEAEQIVISQLEECLSKRNRFPTYCEWRSSKNIRYDWIETVGLFEKIRNYSGAEFESPLKYEVPGELIYSESPILIDTREQQPLFHGRKTSMNVGDYTFDKDSYNLIHVDRKSKSDFISTFTAGLDRFRRECDKASAMGITLVILVEASFADCFKYRPWKQSPQMVTGESAFHGLRKISREYDFQFLFVNDRAQARQYVRKILSNPQIVSDYDLQFLHEKGYF